MFSGKHIRLGKLFGIPFGLDYSFLILMVLGLIMGWAGLYLIIFASIAMHELGHALVARRFGIECKRIVLHVFGGNAALAMKAETTLDARRQAKEEFLIAIAGPLTNFALAGLLTGLTLLVGFNNFWILLAILANLCIGALNLAPVFPLDGGRVLRAALTWRWGYRSATVAVRWVSRMILVMLIALILANGYYFYLLMVAFVAYIGEQEAAACISEHDAAACISEHNTAAARRGGGRCLK